MTDDNADDFARPPPGGAAVAPLCLLARGFAGAAWGTLATALLYSAHAFLALDSLSIHLPAYVFGSLLTGWGVLCLYEYLELSGGDLRPARVLLLMLAAQLYMAPFIVWHKSRPLEPFFMGNYIASMVVLLLTMLLLNLTAAQLLRRLGRPAAGRWAAGLVAVMLLAGLGLLALLGRTVVWADAPTDYSPVMTLIDRSWGDWGVVAAALGTMLVCHFGRQSALERLAGLPHAVTPPDDAEEED